MIHIIYMHIDVSWYIIYKALGDVKHVFGNHKHAQGLLVGLRRLEHSTGCCNVSKERVHHRSIHCQRQAYRKMMESIGTCLSKCLSKCVSSGKQVLLKNSSVKLRPVRICWGKLRNFKEQIELNYTQRGPNNPTCLKRPSMQLEVKGGIRTNMLDL